MKFAVETLVGFLAATVASNVVVAEHEDEPCDNIVDVACGLDDFSTLCTAVQAAGLADALSSGEWTVFAPTNTAFEELGQDLLDLVLADVDVLTDILLFHAVPDVVGSEDLQCTSLVEMANGQDSRTVCTGNGDIHQKGGSNPRNDMPEIVTPDIKTCQGYIHIVDEVMLPGRLGVTLPAKPACQTIPEIACSLDDFSTLCTAVKEAGLVDALGGSNGDWMDGMMHWTVFAPTNDAFAKLGDTLDAVLADKDLLISILLFHAVPEKVLYEQDLRCSRRIEMASGVDSRHVCLGDDLFQKGGGNPRDNMPKIIGTDVGACNGVIHVIDEVMLP